MTRRRLHSSRPAFSIPPVRSPSSRSPACAPARKPRSFTSEHSPCCRGRCAHSHRAGGARPRVDRRGRHRAGERGLGAHRRARSDEHRSAPPARGDVPSKTDCPSARLPISNTSPRMLPRVNARRRTRTSRASTNRSAGPTKRSARWSKRSRLPRPATGFGAICKASSSGSISASGGGGA